MRCATRIGLILARTTPRNSGMLTSASDSHLGRPVGTSQVASLARWLYSAEETTQPLGQDLNHPG